jgi:hypothetical protein
MHSGVTYLAFCIALQCCAASYELSLDELRVFGNRNDGKTLSEEIKEILASRLPLGIERTRLDKLAISAQVTTILNEPETPEQGLFLLRLDSRDADDRVLRRIAENLAPYLRLRLMGHTNAYARSVVWSGLNEIPAELLRRYPFLKSAIKEIGVPWIREDVNRLFALPNWRKEHGSSLVVVDGELAWIYIGQKEPTTFHATCIDALELIPALKGTFELTQARWDLESERLGSDKWSFCSTFLLTNFHIHWRTPRELNPTLIVD